VRFYLEDGSKMMSLISLKTVEGYLPYPEFLRVHRSYIVHSPKIKQVDRLRLFIDDIQIPISETYRDEVLNYFDLHTLT
jgi:DNA-binding LytR/AlgR family response regulator